MVFNRLVKLSSPFIKSSTLTSKTVQRFQIQNKNNFTRWSKLSRNLCTKEGKAATEKTSSAPPPSTITFKEGVKTATSLSIIVGVGCAVIFFGTVIVRELIPTKLSPNSVFNAVFDQIRKHHEVVSRVGENPMAYGRDMHSTKEGRRNVIDHDRYVDLDGVQHLRIKFVISGKNGKLNVFSEKSSLMGPNEFSYIIVEPIVQGRVSAQNEVIAIVDNRKEIPLEEVQKKVAEKLTKLGAKLYGHTNCQWTQRQLIEFGEFSDKLNVVMCDKIENKDECDKSKLPGYPCWTLQSEQLPGFQPLEQLKGIVTHM